MVGHVDFAVLLNYPPVLLAVEVQDRSHMLTRRSEEDADKESACAKLGVHLCSIASPRSVKFVDEQQIKHTICSFVSKASHIDTRMHRAVRMV